MVSALRAHAGGESGVLKLLVSLEEPERVVCTCLGIPGLCRSLNAEAESGVENKDSVLGNKLLHYSVWSEVGVF